MFELSLHKTEYFKHKILTVTERLDDEDLIPLRCEIYTPCVKHITTLAMYRALFEYVRTYVVDVIPGFVRLKPTRLLLKQRLAFSIVDLTDKEADHYVLNNNSVVRTFPVGDPIRVVDTLRDYRYLVLESAGRVVLLPKTNRGHSTYREGQIRRLVSFGMSVREASMYYKVGKHVPYYLEAHVVDWYVKEACSNWLPYLEQPDDLWKWVKEHGYNAKMRDRGFTIKRLATVLAMVRLMQDRLNASA